MAKAIVCSGTTQVVAGVASVSYTVSVIDTVSFSYGGDYKVNTGISVAANLLAFQNKIVAEAAAKGTTILTTDVIIFGAPT